MKVLIVIIFVVFAGLAAYGYQAPTHFEQKNVILETMEPDVWLDNAGNKRPLAQSSQFDILSVKLIEEAPRVAWFEVEYNNQMPVNEDGPYLGALQQSNDREVMQYFAYQPSGVLKQGRGVAKVRLMLSSSAGNLSFFADQVRFNAYYGGQSEFHQEIYEYARTWCGNDAPFFALWSECRANGATADVNKRY